MHPEAREELNVRLKLTVLDYAKYFGATKACREFNVPRSWFFVGNRPTSRTDERACIERSPSPTAIHAKQRLKW